ncbi:hypothetical protein [Candidatus Nanohalovita haloferacivicina]|uniref:hypothetical protein n=1 Tax=Candidatus Nanohalovita haloferacivicina TaxID=2978046 RepID=UPI00325F9B51|nr:hypothetical protein HBNXNv_1099 [Candidatus Nanohalobia archaeon BNXNv]
MADDNNKQNTVNVPTSEQTRQFHESNKIAMTDGGGTEDNNDSSSDSSPETPENDDSGSTFQRLRERVGLGSGGFLGIGEDHVRPGDAVREALSEDRDVDRDSVDEAVSSFGSLVDDFDAKRSDLETDMQRRRQSYETALSEPASQVADAISQVIEYANEPIEDDMTHDFDPHQGSHSFEEWDEEDLGLAAYLSRLSDEVEEFDERYTHREDKIASKQEEIEEKREELEAAREDYEEAQAAIEAQEESANSSAIGSEDGSSAAQAELDAAKGTLERKREELNDVVADLEDDIQRHGEIKREHLESFNVRHDAATSAYREVAEDTESFVEDVYEELDYLTSWIEDLAENQIGNMAAMLDERGVSFEGKILDDAEGDLQSAYNDAVNALGSKAARQYAQADKAVRELEYLEDAMGAEYFEDEFVAEDLRDRLSELTDGEEFETYLDEKLSEAVSDNYSARDEIRNVFRGLEGLMDEEELA